MNRPKCSIRLLSSTQPGRVGRYLEVAALRWWARWTQPWTLTLGLQVGWTCRMTWRICMASCRQQLRCSAFLTLYQATIKFQFTLGRILGELPFFVRNFCRTQLIPKPSCGAPTFRGQLSSLSPSENNCIQFFLPLRVVATCKPQRRFLPTWSQRFFVLKSGPN